MQRGRVPLWRKISTKHLTGSVLHINFQSHLDCLIWTIDNPKQMQNVFCEFMIQNDMTTTPFHQCQYLWRLCYCKRSLIEGGWVLQPSKLADFGALHMNGMQKGRLRLTLYFGPQDGTVEVRHKSLHPKLVPAHMWTCKPQWLRSSKNIAKGTTDLRAKSMLQIR